MFNGFVGNPQLRPNSDKSNLEKDMSSEKRLSVIRSKRYVWAEIMSSTYDLISANNKPSLILKFYFEQII